MTGTLRIGLVGPDQSQPCGIADYTSHLALALSRKCDLVFVPYRDAEQSLGQGGQALAKSQVILVQYERSLVPDRDYLWRLSKKFPGRVFVVPHEVYGDDPFAYPYSAIRSSFPPWLLVKRLVYRWRHREYSHEKSLQRRAYGAEGVLPLSGPGFEILRTRAGKKILEPVPLAYFTPSLLDLGEPALRREKYFPQGAATVLGIFGFLNPGLDYPMVFDLLERVNSNLSLLIIGGPRPGGVEAMDLKAQVAKRDLIGRVHLTGYLPEAELYAHLRLCDLFICPMRFKSNSSSLLNLIHLGKPILASDLPLTRYLKAEGAPVELYADVAELVSLVKDVQDGKLKSKPNRYPWDFNTAAEAYVRVLGAAIRS